MCVLRRDDQDQSRIFVSLCEKWWDWWSKCLQKDKKDREKHLNMRTHIRTHPRNPSASCVCVSACLACESFEEELSLPAGTCDRSALCVREREMRHAV